MSDATPGSGRCRGAARPAPRASLGRQTSSAPGASAAGPSGRGRIVEAHLGSARGERGERQPPRRAGDACAAARPLAALEPGHEPGLRRRVGDDRGPADVVEQRRRRRDRDRRADRRARAVEPLRPDRERPQDRGLARPPRPARYSPSDGSKASAGQRAPPSVSSPFAVAGRQLARLRRRRRRPSSRRWTKTSSNPLAASALYASSAPPAAGAKDGRVANWPRSSPSARSDHDGRPDRPVGRDPAHEQRRPTRRARHHRDEHRAVRRGGSRRSRRPRAARRRRRVSGPPTACRRPRGGAA